MNVPIVKQPQIVTEMRVSMVTKPPAQSLSRSRKLSDGESSIWQELSNDQIAREGFIT